MKRTKVLHVITHLGVGGALDNTLLTVERLPRRRYQIDLAAGCLPVEEGYTSWEHRARDGADNLFLLPELQRAIHPIRDFRAYVRLAALIRSERYDIVHTHCSKAGIVGRFAARRAGAPVIVHTCHAFGGQVTRDSFSPSGSLRRRLKEKCLTFAERWAGRISDSLITVCSKNRQHAMEQKLAAPENITTIYSGIDLAQFDVRTDRESFCQRLGMDPHCPILVFAGRLAVQKAPLDFVAAAKIVLERRPDAQVLIAGDGPLAEDVQSAVADQPRIRCLGFFPNVPELLGAADALGVSSLWEGLGRSVTEAMIVGVPVAATAVDGVPELVVHEETGLLSQPRDIAGLAENLIRLLDQPEEARTMAHQARRRVVPEFGADRMLEKIDALYQQLLQTQGLALEQSRTGQTEMILP